MPLFLDACALAKRYLHEGVSTRRMQQITGRFTQWGGFVVSSLIEPEVISAFAKHARSWNNPTHRAQHLRRHAALVEAFRRDLSKAAFSIVHVTDDAIEQAADLLRAHPEYEIGAGDAIHLVTAKTVSAKLAPHEPLVFVTADHGLATAAKQNGFIVLNPLKEGIEALERVPGLDPEKK